MFYKIDIIYKSQSIVCVCVFVCVSCDVLQKNRNNCLINVFQYLKALTSLNKRNNQSKRGLSFLILRTYHLYIYMYLIILFYHSLSFNYIKIYINSVCCVVEYIFLIVSFLSQLEIYIYLEIDK